MTTVEDIKKAIAALAPREFDRLRAWFEEYQAGRFDEKIERDAAAGRLDRFADAALDDHRKGRSRLIPRRFPRRSRHLPRISSSTGRR